MKKKVKIELTIDELSVIWDCIQSTKDCLQWDEDLQEYTDGGRFIIGFSEKEYKVLQGIVL